MKEYIVMKPGQSARSRLIIYLRNTEYGEPRGFERPDGSLPPPRDLAAVPRVVNGIKSFLI